MSFSGPRKTEAEIAALKQRRAQIQLSFDAQMKHINEQISKLEARAAVEEREERKRIEQEEIELYIILHSAGLEISEQSAQKLSEKLEALKDVADWRELLVIFIYGVQLLLTKSLLEFRKTKVKDDDRQAVLDALMDFVIDTKLLEEVIYDDEHYKALVNLAVFMNEPLIVEAAANNGLRFPSEGPIYDYQVTANKSNSSERMIRAIRKLTNRSKITLGEVKPQEIKSADFYASTSPVVVSQELKGKLLAAIKSENLDEAMRLCKPGLDVTVDNEVMAYMIDVYQAYKDKKMAKNMLAYITKQYLLYYPDPSFPIAYAILKNLEMVQALCKYTDAKIYYSNILLAVDSPSVSAKILRFILEQYIRQDLPAEQEKIAINLMNDVSLGIKVDDSPGSDKVDLMYRAVFSSASVEKVKILMEFGCNPNASYAEDSNLVIEILKKTRSKPNTQYEFSFVMAHSLIQQLMSDPEQIYSIVNHQDSTGRRALEYLLSCSMYVSNPSDRKSLIETIKLILEPIKTRLGYNDFVDDAFVYNIIQVVKDPGILKFMLVYLKENVDPDSYLVMMNYFDDNGKSPADILMARLAENSNNAELKEVIKFAMENGSNINTIDPITRKPKPRAATPVELMALAIRTLDVELYNRLLVSFFQEHPNMFDYALKRIDVEIKRDPIGVPVNFMEFVSKTGLAMEICARILRSDCADLLKYRAVNFISKCEDPKLLAKLRGLDIVRIAEDILVKDPSVAPEQIEHERLVLQKIKDLHAEFSAKTPRKRLG